MNNPLQSYIRITAVTLFSVIFLTTGCSKKEEKKDAGKKRPPVAVTATVAETRDMPVILTGIGNVEPYTTATIVSRVSGRITSIRIKEGDMVRAGDVIATIDSRGYEASLKQAEANLKKDIAQLKLAEAQKARYAELLQKGYVSQVDADQMRTSADALSAVVEADRAAIEALKIQLSYCTITSPVTGKAGAVMIDSGNLVKENDKTIVQIHQVQPVNLVFSVPETKLGAVKAAMQKGALPVDAEDPATAAKVATGKLTFIDNAIDATTGRIMLKATFDNADNKLWPGQFLQAKLQLGLDEAAVVVPSQAVQTGQKGQFVYVIADNNTVSIAPVKVARGAGKVTVLSEGLQAGQKVVLDGQLRLFPGAQVQVKDPKAEGKGEKGGKATAPEGAERKGGK